MKSRLPTCLGMFALCWMLAAGNANGAVLELGSATADAGGVAMVPVRLIPGPDEEVASLQFDLVFDEGDLVLLDAVVGSAAGQADKLLHHRATSPGKIRFIVAGLNQLAIETGVIADCRFQVRSPQGEGLPLQIASVVLSDPFGMKIPAVIGVAGNGSNETSPMSSADTGETGVRNSTAFPAKTAATVLVVAAAVLIGVRAMRKGVAR